MAYGKSSTGIGSVFLKACDRRNHAEASGFQHSQRSLELRLSLWRRLIACGLSLYILVESAKSEVGQTIGLCRLSPLLLEPDRPQKTMVCPTCFHQFSKGVHSHCVQAISLMPLVFSFEENSRIPQVLISSLL